MSLMCSLYTNELNPIKHSRIKKQEHLSCLDRRKVVQNDYYKRRGYFVSYRRKIAKKLGLELEHFSNILTLEQLEEFSRNYLLQNHGAEVSVKPSLYLLRCI